MKILEGYPRILVDFYHEIGFSEEDILNDELNFLESEEQFKEWIQDCPFSFDKK